MKHQTLSLYDYHVWANQKFFDHLKELPQNIYDEEMQSVFPSISQAFAHMYVADTIWLGVMSSGNYDEIKALAGRMREKIKAKGIEEMESMFFNLSEQYKAFFDRQENLDQAIFYEPEYPGFGRLETNLLELVQHVVNHGTYHRGNITAMLRQLGYSGVMTDYVVYLYAMNMKK
jgi:uncharacterized damage-inducible protein DinB